MQSGTIFTIGYEGRELSGFVSSLRAVGVQRLVDVRELPLSRRRGFSKTALATALQDAGIEYTHVKALGNPKPNRDRWKAGELEQGRAVYRAHLHNGSYPALVELAGTLDETRTCLLCVERDHETCHRAVIVEALEERLGDLSVVHL